MPTSGADSSGSPVAVVRRPSRYESQKRRDWQTFTRYLCAHLPPLQLRRCSGAHVLEFLRYLDRFGKTRVHAPPCPAYGGGGGAQQPEPACQCPLRQAWGSLDALVGRLRAAYNESHGAADGGANPFAARAVRLYLRDVRDAQSVARGISYNRMKKKKRSKQDGCDVDDAVQQCGRTHVKNDAALMATAAPPELHPPYPPPPLASLNGVPFECCDFSSVLGGPSASGAPAACYGTFYLPLLFNTFG